MTLLAETTAGMHNLFRLSSLASLEGFYRKPRFDRELLQTYGNGPHRHHRLPVRRGQPLAAGRAVRQGPGRRRRLPRHLRAGQLLLRADGPRPRHRAPTTRQDLLQIARALDLPLLATNDLHYTLRRRRRRPRGAAVRADRQDAGRPEPVPVRRARDFYLKTAAEMRAIWSELPEACDNTLLIAERCDVQFAEGADLMPRFPVPDGGDRGVAGWSRRSSAGWHERFPDGVPDAHRKQADVRGRRHLPDGLPRLLPGHRRPRALRQGERHPGRPGPRLGGRRRRSPTRWASPSSTRSSTGCCSSGSSTPSASRCPTSTWTSTSAGAAT